MDDSKFEVGLRRIKKQTHEQSSAHRQSITKSCQSGKNTNSRNMLHLAAPCCTCRNCTKLWDMPCNAPLFAPGMTIALAALFTASFQAVWRRRPRRCHDVPHGWQISPLFSEAPFLQVPSSQIFMKLSLNIILEGMGRSNVINHIKTASKNYHFRLQAEDGAAVSKSSMVSSPWRSTSIDEVKHPPQRLDTIPLFPLEKT